MYTVNIEPEDNAVYVRVGVGVNVADLKILMFSRKMTTNFSRIRLGTTYTIFVLFLVSG